MTVCLIAVVLIWVGWVLIQYDRAEKTYSAFLTARKRGRFRPEK